MSDTKNLPSLEEEMSKQIKVKADRRSLHARYQELRKLFEAEGWVTKTSDNEPWPAPDQPIYLDTLFDPWFYKDDSRLVVNLFSPENEPDVTTELRIYFQKQDADAPYPDLVTYAALTVQDPTMSTGSGEPFDQLAFAQHLFELANILLAAQKNKQLSLLVN